MSEQNQTQNYALGIGCVLLATLGWSLSGAFVRQMPGLDGWQLNCWRGFWMAIGLLCYLVAVYGDRTLEKFLELPWFATVASATCFALGSTLYITSLTMVSTATISVIGASSPLFTGLLSPWTTGERPGPIAWFSAVMALAGVGIIAWDGLEGGKLIGILVCLCVPITFSGQTLMLRRYRNYDMVPAICVGGFLCFLAAGFLGFVNGRPGGGFDVGLRELLILAIMGPVQLTIPLILFAKSAKSVPAVTLALIAMLDCVLNPFWSWLTFGEKPEPSTFIGGSVVVVAVVISIFANTLIARFPRRLPAPEFALAPRAD